MLNDDEESVARAIRLAGARSPVPSEREQRVRRRLKAEWLNANRRRVVRRRAGMAVALLGVAAAIVIAARVWTNRDTGVISDHPAAIVATVERVDRHMPHTAGQAIHADEVIETAADGRVALGLQDRTAIRLDEGTRVRFVDPATIELTTGAIYVDTGSTSTGVLIRTPFGTVRDVGTQFEVRMTASVLKISVRTGRVELVGRAPGPGASERSEPVSIGPGMQLSVNDKGSEMLPIPPTGSLWSWTASLSPVFDIEGKPLGSFLEHLAREHGWTVRYEDAQLARDASGIILHGSIAGLAPEDALAVAVRTSGLAHRMRQGEVVVSRGANRR